MKVISGDDSMIAGLLLVFYRYLSDATVLKMHCGNLLRRIIDEAAGREAIRNRQNSLLLLGKVIHK